MFWALIYSGNRGGKLPYLLPIPETSYTKLHVKQNSNSQGTDCEAAVDKNHLESLE